MRSARWCSVHKLVNFRYEQQQQVVLIPVQYVIHYCTNSSPYILPCWYVWYIGLLVYSTYICVYIHVQVMSALLTCYCVFVEYMPKSKPVSIFLPKLRPLLYKYQHTRSHRAWTKSDHTTHSERERENAFITRQVHVTTHRWTGYGGENQH